MLKQLIPKEEKYFEDFKEMISHISGMAQYTNQLLSSDVIDVNLLLKIKPLEQRCDEISSKIIKRLNKTFITPFDREDIFGLVKRLSAISDNLLGVASRIETFLYSYFYGFNSQQPGRLSGILKRRNTPHFSA